MDNHINLSKKMTGSTLKTSSRKTIISHNKNIQNIRKSNHKIYIWQRLVEINHQVKITRDFNLIKTRVFNLINFLIAFSLL